MSDSATAWTVAHQASPSRDSPGKSTGVGCRCLLQGNLPDPGVKPRSPALEADALTSEPPGKPLQVEEGFEILYYLQGAEQIYAHRILGIKFTNQSCQTPQYASFTGYSSSFIGKPFLRCPRRGKLQRRYTFQTKTVANCSNSSQLNDTT